MFCNSTITDLFLFVFTQLILHYPHQKSKIYNGIVDIIPMDTKTFIEFFKQATSKDIGPKDLYSIHEHSTSISIQMLIEGKTEEDWHNSVIEKVFEVVN